MKLKSLFSRIHRWAITEKMFMNLFATGTIIEFSQVGAGFIDGIIISRFLGAEAIAAEARAHKAPGCEFDIEDAHPQDVAFFRLDRVSTTDVGNCTV